MYRIAHRGIVFLALALFAGALPMICGCARYAPEPVAAPKRVVMEIVLTMEEPVSSDFQYYVAMNITTDAGASGPSEQLSGTDRAKNWNYYIVYDGPSQRFMEKAINTAADIDIIPTFFDESSPRYYYAAVSGNRIYITLYLDTLAATAQTRVWLNFITSRYAIHDPEQDQIDAVDYLYPPYFYFMYGTLPLQISDANYAQISSYNPTEQGAGPANITDWSISVYER